MLRLDRVDAEGRRIPWPEVSRFDENEMRDLIREIVNKIYMFFVKGEDPDFVAFSDYVRPATYEWDKPKIDFRYDASCEGIRP